MCIIDVKLNLCALHYLGAEVQFLVVRFNKLGRNLNKYLSKCVNIKQ